MYNRKKISVTIDCMTIDWLEVFVDLAPQEKKMWVKNENTNNQRDTAGFSHFGQWI